MKQAAPRLWAIALLLALTAVAAQAQPKFPALTGRVVDQAQVLDPASERRLSQTLEAHERATTEQIVVVTVPDLQGYTIEEYGYQLGRHWGIGQAGRDNGALLIVAPNERRVRIEVGYGLEGRLTDAQSAIIIDQAITPAFQQGDYTGGIVNGVNAILRVLGGEPLPAQSEPRPEADGPRHDGFSPLFFILLFIILSMLRRGRRRSLLGAILLGSTLGRGGRHGGFGGRGGGGFRGGGGGFGGGGASGGR